MGRKKKLSNMSPEEIGNLSVNDFATMLAKEMVDGISEKGAFVMGEVSNGSDYVPQGKRYFPALQRGDIVGGIYETCNYDGIKSWYLFEDKISKVGQTREGWKYYTKSKFRPLYAEDVDSSTRMMEDAIGKGYIITSEVFGLNDKTRPFAERWVEWANENKDKAVSILDADLDATER